jgi:hypothetical protein
MLCINNDLEAILSLYHRHDNDDLSNVIIFIRD